MHESPPVQNYLSFTCLIGEEDVLKPAEADMLEALNTPLENDHQDNEFIPHILY